MDPRRLREETRAEHEATEALMPLTGEGLTQDVYVRTLEILQMIIGSWEVWAQGAAPAHLKSLLVARQRSPLLAADLATLQGFAGQGEAAEASGEQRMDWQEIVTGADGVVPEPEFSASFLGALYVIEGSTLGGRYIARHVESALGFVPGQGNAYFQGHGEATGSMWREVTAEIGAVPEELSPQVIAAARRTFRAFGDALRTGIDAQETVHG